MITPLLTLPEPSSIVQKGCSQIVYPPDYAYTWVKMKHRQLSDDRIGKFEFLYISWTCDI